MRATVSSITTMLLVTLTPASAATHVGASPDRAVRPIYAAGGSPVTGGVFFPGTAVFDGTELRGIPYEITEGDDLEFTTVDGPTTLSNGHRIVSFKQRRGLPLFRSGLVYGPGSGLLITSHLKAGRGELPDGSYGFYCDVHTTSMFGILKVNK